MNLQVKKPGTIARFLLFAFLLGIDATVSAESLSRLTIVKIESEIGARNVDGILIDSKSYAFDQDGVIDIQLPAGERLIEVPGFQPKSIPLGIDESVQLNISFQESNGKSEKGVMEVEAFRYQESLEKNSISTSVAQSARPRDSEDGAEILVLAPKNKGNLSALVEVRRQSSQVAEVLGSEQMAKQGDSDAASSLRRVTGLTLVGGKFVYVRGLGERYSAVQMNGFQLPSPEPSRRVVPLDLFPVGILESVFVSKSFSPELPAHFGGGLISLKTKSLPEKTFARVSLSNDLSSPTRLKTSAGGSRDFFGEDDGTRSLPKDIQAALGSGRKFNEASPTELQTWGLSLNNNYKVEDTAVSRIPSLSLGVGGKKDFGAHATGIAVGLMHGSSYNQIEKKNQKFNVGAGSQLERSEQGTTEENEIERKISANLDLGYEFKKNKLRVTQLFLRNTTDTVRVKEFSQSGDRYSSRQQTNLDFVQRDLQVTQISGEHPIANDKNILKWRLGLSKAFRAAPDGREFVYVNEGNQVKKFEYLPDATGNRRVYSTLNDTSNESGLDLVFNEVAQLPVNVTFGLVQNTRVRSSETYRLHLQSNFASGNQPDFSLPPEILFSQRYICPDCFVITNLTNSADSYSGDEVVNSQYAQFDWTASKNWSLQAGVREEISKQEVKTFFYFDRERPTSLAGMKNRNLLPAYSLNWKSNNDKWRVRTAYSETLVRPDFRELSTVEFFDDESGYYTFGNSELRATVIKNLDHRWEYYFSEDEFFSVGVFRKDFTSPIEEVFEPSPNLRKTFSNADSAINQGIEFETRVDLKHISRDWRRWGVLANVSLIGSKVTLPESSIGVQTNSERALQGQSPYVINLQLQYARPQQKTQAGLLYNRIGRRITEVGTSGRPDIFEEPFDQVDFIYTQGFKSGINLQLRAKNLLDPEALATQGGEMVRSAKKGRSLHVGVSAQF